MLCLSYPTPSPHPLEIARLARGLQEWCSKILMSKDLEVKILTTKELVPCQDAACTTFAFAIIGYFGLAGKVRCHTRPVEN